MNKIPAIELIFKSKTDEDLREVLFSSLNNIKAVNKKYYTVKSFNEIQQSNGVDLLLEFSWGSNKNEREIDLNRLISDIDL